MRGQGSKNTVLIFAGTPVVWLDLYSGNLSVAEEKEVGPTSLGNMPTSFFCLTPELSFRRVFGWSGITCSGHDSLMVRVTKSYYNLLNDITSVKFSASALQAPGFVSLVLPTGYGVM